MKPRRPRFGRLIAVEGIDGAGKTTFVRHFVRTLRARGFRAAVHHEPTDPELGARAQSAAKRDPWTGAIYFTIDRFRARLKLEALLARNDLVVEDRSYFSTMAYQGSAIPRSLHLRLEQLQLRSTVAPDRVILLDLPVSTALSRVSRRRKNRAPLERKRLLERVRSSYRTFSSRPGWHVLDARRPRRDLVKEALEWVVPEVPSDVPRLRRRSS